MPYMLWMGGVGALQWLCGRQPGSLLLWVCCVCVLSGVLSGVFMPLRLTADSLPCRCLRLCYNRLWVGALVCLLGQVCPNSVRPPHMVYIYSSTIMHQPGGSAIYKTKNLWCLVSSLHGPWHDAHSSQAACFCKLCCCC